MPLPVLRRRSSHGRGGGTRTRDCGELAAGSGSFVITLFDHIDRAQSFISPHAVAAFVLNSNNIVGNNFVADRNTLPKVKMPNQNHFMWQDPQPGTSARQCMRACANPNKIKIVSMAEEKN